MKKNRVKIPDDLSAEILFASDRQCCVCRDSSRKVEIHHIDNDPSNNAIENLAVMCKDDHSEAHTKYAFARNLSADLVRKYNETWRTIVRARITPGGESALKIEYQQQLLLEIGLIPHSWKKDYINLYPGHFLASSSSESGGDVWDLFLEFGIKGYSEDKWKKYAPLFDRSIIGVVDALQRILSAHGQHVPIEMKLAILKTSSQISRERSVYLQLPQIILVVPGISDTFFTERFERVIRALSELTKASDKERKTLEAKG